MEHPVLPITAVVVTYRRLDWLKRAIAALERAAARDGRVRVRLGILVNGPDAETAAWISEAIARGAFAFAEDVRFLGSPDELVPAAARNRVIDEWERSGTWPLAPSEWFYFLDDDAYMSEDFFSAFRAALGVYPRAAVIGGPNLTPPESGRFQQAVGSVLSSRLAAYSSRVRYKPEGRTRLSDEHALILCNLFIRREALGTRRFPEDFFCNEENWLLQELESEGHPLIHCPELSVWHERRPRVRPLSQQVWKYGIGRGKNLRRRPNSFHWAHVLPSLCVALALTAAVGAAFGAAPWLGSAVLALGTLYVGLVLTCSALSKDPAWAIVLFPLIHVSYGLGVLRGLILNR